MFSWFFSAVCYGLAWLELSKYTVGEEDTEQLQQLKRKTLWIPLVFMVTRAPGIADILYRVNYRNKTWLLVLRAIGDPMQGFCNACVYSLSSETVRQNWLKLFRGNRDELIPLPHIQVLSS
eukprot:NODE_4123_length_695_cov_60.597523_g3496_i0.p1 GENE.NODE_4123_length_695_cov_60.597523_g3496_i0~~NODE_4123_length_695_cov_60.597523_g3496_i0.p1  ORF type:complete len:121 (-),score=27.86 NODE_4123_length_695_cov_60.597523_g3496_i0:83-445(-)